MTPRLRVLAPGLLTTVQDAGRPGLEHLGVPPSGAMDPGALRLANSLAGNPAGTAGLELTIQGGRYEVLDADCVVALAGAAPMHAIEPRSGSVRALAPWQTHRLRRGTVLAIGTITDGLRAWLAVCGGIAVPPVLGSAATLTRAALGGWQGRALQRGDELPVGEGRAPERRRWLSAREAATRHACGPVGVVLGPQDDHFAPAEIARFLAATYTQAPQSDRMGCRLDGARIAHARGADIVTDPIAAGSIQIPGSGQPLIALADRQTTGGYPKIATVITADLARLAQLRPGQPLRFEAVDLDTAVQRARAARRRLDALDAALRADPNFEIFPLLSS